MTAQPIQDPTFKDLGINAALLNALDDEGYTHPTPIQAGSIPSLLEGRDLLGLAQTGTGKTAAFTLPMLQRLSNEKPKRNQKGRVQPRALILAPTRELAVQISDSIKTYGRNTKLTHTVILGGVGQYPQVRDLGRGIDIIVATPGRLLDLMEQGHAKLRSIEMLVLDEADRMLDMGFINDVRKIVAALSEDRQSLLFSATMPRDVEALAHDMLRDPLRIEVTPEVVTVEKIDQRVFHVDKGNKRNLLVELLADPALAKVIVFTRTKHGANKVCEVLEKSGISADAIHGNKSQGARQMALKRFRDGKARVLVATDIAARGIDVDGVTHVVNFELPNVPESYVHRIGRTARAGADGIALSFCDHEERAYLKDILRMTGAEIATVEFDGLTLPEPDMAQRFHAPKQGGRNGGGGRGRGKPGVQKTGGNRSRSASPKKPFRADRPNRADGETAGGERKPFRADKPRPDRPKRAEGERTRSDKPFRSDKPRSDRPKRAEGETARGDQPFKQKRKAKRADNADHARPGSQQQRSEYRKDRSENRNEGPKQPANAGKGGFKKPSRKPKKAANANQSKSGGRPNAKPKKRWQAA